ncbi:hypothetical protein PHYPSEUDO_013195 [Phytophthora pseudosyringae]|uniref:Uncharacterized protein n=1 Tax=Phytophthora pseudosyringae TaxID=221518 RepID=A0A8T1W4A8_9STRA|nr:hypothetical protein PHYPSEUDO_013195 [Phytophthora pseudosyringae]
MVLSWRKATIHLKQEKVLLEAQQTMGKLSYYHPQQQVYATQARRTGNRKKASKKLPTWKEKLKVGPKDDTNTRSESIRRMRRMLDPTEYASYSRFYQESAKEVSWNEPNCRATKPAPAKIRVGLSESNLEPRGRMYNDQSPRGSQICRDKPETCYCVESSDEDIEKGTINGIEIANCNSRDASRATGKKSVLTRDVPVPPVTSDQVSFKLQNIHPSAESEGHSYRDHLPVLPELRDQPQSTNTKAAENVLPLFDDEVEAGKITNQTNHIDISPHRVRFAPDLRSTQAANTLVQAPCADQNESFVERGGRDPDLRRNPQALVAESREYAYDVRLARGANPVMFNSSLCLAPAPVSDRIDQQHQPRVVKTRRTGRKKQIKVVNSGSIEERPLADILELNDRGEANLSEYSETHAKTTWNAGDVWDASVLKEMVTFYADSVMAHAGESIGQKTTRVRVCYRMARDFALLQNDFYIGELQEVYDANFKGASINLSRSAVDAGKLEEETRLELFLEQLVESHPAYREYIDLSLRRNDAHSPAPVRALNWLAQHHLRPQLTLQKRARARQRKAKTHWIWEPMPAEMDIALEKLLPAIKKYMRVLGQFFLRQAVQSSSTTDKPQDCRMSRTAFISLMKQLRVFPQLFHRRELENAVRLSCCSSPEAEELNFPEFIEALVRCSCNLRWGELDEGKHASESSSGNTVVVIKFVMLIFAMEGQGSVLKKRNEDVSAILGFLGQQQKKQQAEKLFRFRKMLAENKRRSRASKNHQLPSVWNQVRLQFSPKRSPTKSQDTFHELTESWDGGSPRHVSTEPFVFDAQTNQPFDLDVPPSPNVDAIAQQSQQGSVGFVNTGQDGDHLSGGSVDGASFRPPSSSELLPSTFVLGATSKVVGQSEATALQEELAAAMELNTAPTVHRELEESIPATRDSDSLATTASVEFVVNSEQVRHCTASPQSTALVEPMEKDEFLREILDSIGDVELMLSQPKFTGSNYSKHGRIQSRKTLTSTSVESTHGEDNADLMEGFLSLSELAGGNLVQDWQHHHDSTLSSNADADCEAQVRDPMLNCLTDLERFTESTDHASLVAIASMAGLPFTQDPAPQVICLARDP